MTWDDPYRTGWTKAPPVMVAGQSEADFENVLHAFFREQNEIKAAKWRQAQGVVIGDSELQQPMIKDTAPSRRWLHPAYENNDYQYT